MGDKISRNMFIVILAAALLITAANQVMNPLAYEVVEEETWWYNRAGVNFEGDAGMRFNYSKLGDSRLSYEEGYSFRVRYENETHLPNIAFSWDDLMPMNMSVARAPTVQSFSAYSTTSGPPSPTITLVRGLNPRALLIFHSMWTPSSTWR